MPELPYRQVHLDFHTSPHIPGVGSRFDATDFVRTLVRARVSSVTCFSRCHHGLIYHDTRFLELRHPQLSCNLLVEQVEACHRAGIRVPVYITVGWDDLQGRRHPEWLELDADGRVRGPGPLQPGFARKLCLNTPYVDFVLQQTEEVLGLVPCDGLFFDIVLQGECLCPFCLAAMERQGLDPASAAARQRHADQVLDRFNREMTALVRARAPRASIFYNAGHVGPAARRTLDQVTHLELESLPTGHWGPLHFPLTASWARGLGLPVVGMTTAFHTTWGDFGSFKSRAALEQECFSMLAHGARCSVGDQLHPQGRLDRATYELIGQVFAQVEAKEPWCEGAEPVSEIGVFHAEAFAAADGLVDSSTAGAHQILAQGHRQFDLIDGERDLGRYRVLLIPDKIRVGDRLAASLRAYLARGGALIASGRSCVAAGDERFALEEMGAELLGEAELWPDFLVPGPALAPGLPRSALVMYDRPLQVRPAPGTEVLASALSPYFNRTARTYCSHLHAPAAGPAPYPAVIRRGRIIYFAHPLFATYRRTAAPWCRDLVLNALSLLLPDPLVQSRAPVTCRVHLTRQARSQRLVLHLLHYVSEPGGMPFTVVDQIIPLTGVELRVRTGARPARVQLAPGGEELSFVQEGHYVRFTVLRLEGHAMVVLEGV